MARLCQHKCLIMDRVIIRFWWSKQCRFHRSYWVAALLGRAWASPTLAWLHCVCGCVSMLVRLFVWTNHLLEILNEQIQILHEDRYREAVEGYCQSAASGTQSDDDWTWNTFGTGLCFYQWRQAAHRRYKFDMDGGWLGRFRWRAMHKWHSEMPEI